MVCFEWQVLKIPLLFSPFLYTRPLSSVFVFFQSERKNCHIKISDTKKHNDSLKICVCAWKWFFGSEWKTECLILISAKLRSWKKTRSCERIIVEKWLAVHTYMLNTAESWSLFSRSRCVYIFVWDWLLRYRMLLRGIREMKSTCICHSVFVYLSLFPLL